jgi:hypothetical protein
MGTIILMATQRYLGFAQIRTNIRITLGLQPPGVQPGVHEGTKHRSPRFGVIVCIKHTDFWILCFFRIFRCSLCYSARLLPILDWSIPTVACQT